VLFQQKSKVNIIRDLNVRNKYFGKTISKLVKSVLELKDKIMSAINSQSDLSSLTLN